ncbi:MAG TPA: aminotransferase class I/II-fold pyridoxal phosphate-dependent enzyme [Geminicoccaceae bacterium]|nr:aminotransferase class I/II-fold pyridoxal phosphate-dependent enzyme [Geminicoccaceae bacterium]
MATRPLPPRHRRPKIAGRGAVSPFVVMEVLAAANRRAAAGGEVLHLEVGEPMGPPAAVIEAAHRALDRAPLGYTEALGLRPLRERIARHYGEWYGLDLDPARVAVTLGASGAFILAFLAAFDPGDRVAVAEPGYPAYRNILRALGVEVVRLPVGPETRFQPTPAMLEAAAAAGGRLDGLVVASPANPTGTVLGRAELAALVDLCADRGMRLVADEIYHGITYDAPAAGVLAEGGDGEGGAIVVNSFSKYFRMTGWRLGWLVLPPELTGAVERLAQNLFISPPTLAQHAALAAFACDAELRAEVERYRRNRDLLLRRLPAAGLTRFAPADGAFYLYADVRHLTADSPALCRRLLDETGVAVTPGVDFDTGRGGGYVRLSFAGPTDEVATAADRLCARLGAAA